GIAPRKAQHMLVPLLRSVADNIEHVGVPRALSGVIRRGDVVTLRNHIEKLSSTAPRHLSLYLAASYTQLEMARQLGDTSENNLLDVERLIAASRGSEALLLRES
ncbi:MAG TPA: DUF2520 domain-containing protein, partial [Polyangiaceae bacterium]|nr:DUF2520 domain-containing protein [Polyangiaceae bacterium]